jgi:hypothetical protein
MNTTKLIDQWSMAGADLDLRFGQAQDVRAPSTPGEPNRSAGSQVLLKRAGEDEWRPLGGSELA